MGSILPDSIRGKADLEALDLLAEARLGDLDLSCILIDLLNQVPAAALPALAVQFDVLGLKGWKFVTTTQQKRDLIKKAIELHRFKGTPWSIKEALKQCGVVGTTIIQEGVYRFHDGVLVHDGTAFYGGANWATFIVIIDILNIGNFSLADLSGLINEYKPARCKLENITFQANFTETVPPTESEELGLGFENEIVGVGTIYAGVRLHNGAVLHNRTSYDELVVYQTIGAGSPTLVTGIT